MEILDTGGTPEPGDPPGGRAATPGDHLPRHGAVADPGSSRRPRSGDRPGSRSGSPFDGQPGVAPSGVTEPTTAADAFSVDLGEPAAAPDGSVGSVGADAPPAPSPLRGVLATVTDAGSLALASILVAAFGLTGGFQLVMTLSFDLGGVQTEQEMASAYASGILVCAVPVVVLALAALFRIRADAPPWVRAVTGAAVIVAALLVLLAGYAAWQVAGIPADPDGTGISGG